eukprot:5236410-Amphidinium_carterae.1
MACNDITATTRRTSYLINAFTTTSASKPRPSSVECADVLRAAVLVYTPVAHIRTSATGTVWKSSRRQEADRVNNMTTSHPLRC